MIVTCWILLVFFGILGLSMVFKLFKGDNLNWFESLVMFISVFIAAISAGIIFGGLVI